MPIYRIYKEGELVVGIWKVDETVGELRSMFHQFSIYEEGFNRLKAEKRQREWLAVRVLLKELCGDEKKIAYLSSGKPYLEDESAFISFSHTVGYVAVALHPSVEVGVDIEQYGTRVKRVASKFIREDEQVSIANGDEVYALLLHWSAKETIFKLMEDEAVDFIDHLHIFPFHPQESGTFRACEYRSGTEQQYLIRYETHPDYVLTFCSLE
ncbi:MAG: 4'-phosphopantetheinyl transferase superfamily protein [Parabacteroides sp.]|nr:4'-phosphopantetheinyl transferase superfamily protein [Parabacteroides sp.]